MDHDWREMTWQEAYPATSGRICRSCGTTRLGWLGLPPEATPGLARALGGTVRPAHLERDETCPGKTSPILTES